MKLISDNILVVLSKAMGVLLGGTGPERLLLANGAKKFVLPAARLPSFSLDLLLKKFLKKIRTEFNQLPFCVHTPDEK